MANTFSEIEDSIFFDEQIIFDINKIKKVILDVIVAKLNSKTEKERPFYFEEIVYDFFDYMKLSLIKTKKTRDFGIDGIVKLNIGLFGDITLGLQIKYNLIDSNDVDMFIAALKNAELQMGIIICKDSRRLEKYELNSKIKAILLSKGIKIKEKIIKENININPVLILKMEEMFNIIASNMRGGVMAIYKK